MADERTVRVVRPGEGQTLAVVGDLYTVLAAGEDTQERYALLHALVPPGSGPPPHIHRREEEGFYVLEGELTFWADGQRLTTGPGTFLNLPVGSLHHFKNEGSRPAQMLILVAPAGLERMFREAGRPWPDLTQAPPVTQEEIDRLLAVAPRYGIEIKV
jgi:quercetin dioxygenase-like cupin family protein